MSAFVTTRGGPPVSFSEAVFQGLAPDGGLFVPQDLPRLDDWPPRGKRGDRIGFGATTFTENALSFAPAFFSSLPSDLVRTVVEEALDFPIPVVEVEPGRFVLELFHGPTHAFKDVGARFMARMLPRLDDATPTPRTVLVATSGDTGGAVASAFHGVTGYRVVVLFPQEGVSDRQRRQMTTLGDNVHAISLDGTFDDCQRLVKDSFGDDALRRRHGLTSANSINVARLLPQALYYVHAVAILERLGRRARPPRFVVPSGNLGNLCAGLLAAKAGMPHSGFTAATNVNRGFSDFLNGKPFEARPSVQSVSNAMDVGAPSNLERIRWLYGGDDEALRAQVRGETVTDGITESCIAAAFERTGYLLDPHTAVAYESSSRHDASPDEPVIVLGTAHPGKFPETVEGAIGVAVPLPPGLADFEALPERVLSLDPGNSSLNELLESVPW
jgi:threonine synthase